MKKTVDKSLDIWSFGCLVFELITGQPLVCIPGSEWAIDDYVLALNGRLGDIPQELFACWKTSHLYFTKEGELYNSQLGELEDGEEPLIVEEPSLEQLFDEAAPEIDDREAQQVKKLLRWILQYDPSKRPSPAEISQDPWFRGIQ